jgi:hypothetical protein
MAQLHDSAMVVGVETGVQHRACRKSRNRLETHRLVEALSMRDIVAT